MSTTTNNTTKVMLTNFATMFVALAGAYMSCSATNSTTHRWFADSKTHPTERATELWFLKYGAVWMSAFGVVVASEVYMQWDSMALLMFMFSLAAPLYLQPVLFPGVTAETNVPFLQRFSLKSNVWIAIFGFVGNYWYTHYFYSVLRAQYTMPSYDLNGVPIPMYFATHFYFCFYHVIGNCVLRRIMTGFKPSMQKNVFLCLAVLCMAYTTAFMEVVTISGYKCYVFDDWHHAATVGSMFYAIYFVVSFPMFYLFASKKKGPSMFETGVESLATSMLVLCLLDFVRVWLGQDLVVRQLRPCKLNVSLGCFDSGC